MLCPRPSSYVGWIFSVLLLLLLSASYTRTKEGTTIKLVSNDGQDESPIEESCKEQLISTDLLRTARKIRRKKAGDARNLDMQEIWRNRS